MFNTAGTGNAFYPFTNWQQPKKRIQTMTQEQADNILKELSDTSYIKNYLNPIYNEKSRDLTVHYHYLGGVSTGKLVSFANKNNLLFNISTSESKLAVMFFPRD